MKRFANILVYAILIICATNLNADEWHRVGELPVVIYGSRGELIRVHSTESLSLQDDIQHIKRTVSSYWWNENSISFFGPKEESFIVRLHWRKLLFLSLRNGDLMDVDSKIRGPA